MKLIAVPIALLLSLIVASTAAATTYTVASTADESPAAADNGVCTLREAINMASTNSANPADGDVACGAAGQTSPDTINLSATPILMTAAVGTDDNHDGDFDLLGTGGDLTINATVAGGANAVLHGPVDDRVIDKLAGNTGQLTLNGITVQHGNATATGANAEGGGIRIQGGDLTLSGGSIVQSNGAVLKGGGVFVAGGSDLTVSNATIGPNNTVDVPAGLTANAGGGGIAKESGGITLTNATVTNNTVTRNQAGVAGQTVDGGGILAGGGRVTLTNSTVSGNQVNISGNSGPDEARGGGILAQSVDIGDSTISGNRLSGGASRKGGGIFTKTTGDPPVSTNQIHNVTFSDNGSAAAASGGAIYADGGATLIRFTTFAFDDATSGGALFFDDKGLGGPSMQYTTSIFFGEGCADDDGGVVGPEPTPLGDSVFDTSTGCPLGSGDQTLSLTLNALGNNGGPTRTHGLPLNTPLLNDIPLNRCNNMIGMSPGIAARDQRGFPRAVDGGCEAGAIEVMSCHGQAATILGTSSTDVIPTTPGNDVVVGGNGGDTIQASAGTDTICGDQFMDTIDYSTAPGGGPAVVDLLTGTATLPGKTDGVFDMEQVFGTAAGDTLLGTDANGEMRGNGGNDILNGRGGQDAITGGADVGGIGDQIVFDNASGNVTADLTNTATFQNTGNGTKLITGVESMRGGPFNDQLTGDGAANRIDGAAGADTVHAGGGGDTVTGGPGADSLFGEAGDDLMKALDGEIDNVDCGDGNDTPDVDATDILVACEATAPPPGETPPGETPPGETPPGETPPGETPPATDTKAPVLSLSGKKRQKVGASVSVGALCDEACTAAGSGELVVKAPSTSGKAAAKGKRTFTLKPASLSLAPGNPGTLKLKLSKRPLKAATAALADGGSARVSVTVTATDPSANAAAQVFKVRLIARR